MAIAARLMRRVLVDHARTRGYRKRGGGVERVPRPHGIQSEADLAELSIVQTVDGSAGNDEAPPDIVPVIIEGPPPAKPPAQLNYLHFNDRFMYFISAEQGLR